MQLGLLLVPVVAALIHHCMQWHSVHHCRLAVNHTYCGRVLSHVVAGVGGGVTACTDSLLCAVPVLAHSPDVRTRLRMAHSGKVLDG